jgi:hypothetical protein
MPLFQPAELSKLSDTQITAPDDNDKLTYDAPSQKWLNVFGATVVVSAIPPANPKVGDIWFDIS